MKSSLSAKNPVFETGGLRITQGFGKFGLLDWKKITNPTYIYSAHHTFLLVDRPKLQLPSGNVPPQVNVPFGGRQLHLPARSVALVQPLIDVRLVVAQNEDDGYVFETLLSPEAAYAGKSAPLPIGRGEINGAIKEHFQGQIAIYPASSRVYADKQGNRVESGWFTHNLKNSPLAVGDAAWAQVPSNEVPHCHALSTEIIIVLAGVATLRVDGEQVKLGAGELFVFNPEKSVYHSIESVEAGQGGSYRHICLQYPALFGDSSGRIEKK